jgi:hypothetical protein
MGLSAPRVRSLPIVLAPCLFLAVLAAGPARAEICPDGTEAEFCLPPGGGGVNGTLSGDGRLLPLGAALSWQQFSRDLLDPLPQEVRRDSAVAEPDPEGSKDRPFRFSPEPRNYYSARDGWRLRAFGQGFGGPLVQGAAGGTASFSGAQAGLRLDYATGDWLIGAFGRFAQLWSTSGSLDNRGSGSGSISGQASLGGGGVLVQLNRPDWFVGAAIGGDGLTGDQLLGVRGSSPRVGGSAFNLATNLGGRIRLNGSQFLEPGALLTLSSLSIGGGSVYEPSIDSRFRVSGSSSTVGTADIGVTWRAAMRDGPNLITPSLRLSWLGAGFLGASPANRVTDASGQSTSLPAGSLIQDSGLGLQGSLAYTLSDNTTFYVRGGAGFFGGGTAWDVGGGVQLRWGGAPRASRPSPQS